MGKNKNIVKETRTAEEIMDEVAKATTRRELLLKTLRANQEMKRMGINQRIKTKKNNNLAKGFGSMTQYKIEIDENGKMNFVGDGEQVIVKYKDDKHDDYYVQQDSEGLKYVNSGEELPFVIVNKGNATDTGAKVEELHEFTNGSSSTNSASTKLDNENHIVNHRRIIVKN